MVTLPAPLVVNPVALAVPVESRAMVALPLFVSLKITSLPALGAMEMPPLPDCMVALAPSGPSMVSEEPLGD